MQDKLCNLLEAVHVHAPQPSIAASVTRTVDISPAGKHQGFRLSCAHHTLGRLMAMIQHSDGRTTNAE